MDAYYSYFGGPIGYTQMKSIVSNTPGWSVFYRDSDTTIYRVRVR